MISIEICPRLYESRSRSASFTSSISIGLERKLAKARRAEYLHRAATRDHHVGLGAHGVDVRRSAAEPVGRDGVVDAQVRDADRSGKCRRGHRSQTVAAGAERFRTR